MWFVEAMGWIITMLGAVVMVFMGLLMWHGRNQHRSVNLLQEFSRLRAEEEEILETQRRLEEATGSGKKKQGDANPPPPSH
jgi:hypothetical protein